MRESIRLNTDSLSAHYYLGVALDDRELTDEAINEFRKALSIDPEFGYAYYGLGLSIRPIKCLNKVDVNYVGELILQTEEELQEIRSLGRKSIDQIKETLSEMGLSLGMRVEGWPPLEMIH